MEELWGSFAFWKSTREIVQQATNKRSTDSKFTHDFIFYFIFVISFIKSFGLHSL